MFKLGFLCCLVVVCLAKDKRVLFFGNSGSSGSGLTSGSSNGLTGGNGLLGGSGLMGTLPGLSSSSGGGFFLSGFTNLLQQTTKYWTDLMSKFLRGSSTSSGPGLSLPGLSSHLPSLSGPSSIGGTLPTQVTTLRM